MFSFKKFDEAKDFYEKIGRVTNAWEDRKRQEPKKFRRPGFVALDFLINMWGFQKEDAYKMLKEKIGSYYPPAPIYKGYGVWRMWTSVLVFTLGAYRPARTIIKPPSSSFGRQKSENLPIKCGSGNGISAAYG